MGVAELMADALEICFPKGQAENLDCLFVLPMKPRSLERDF